MNKKNLFWLNKELPKWQEQGLISDENADKLLSQYGKEYVKGSNQVMQKILMSIGALLVLLGIVFVSAGYWYQISPSDRFNWSLGLDVFALILAALGLLYGKRSSALKEMAGIFYFSTVLLTMYLMNSTYYLGQTHGLYLLISLALIFPMAYILESALGMSAYFISVAIWSGTKLATDFYLIGNNMAWGLLLIALPFLLMYKGQKTKWSQGKIILSWTAVFSTYIVFFNTFAKGIDGTNGLLLMANLAVITMSLGWLGKKGFWTKPLRLTGFAGLLYVIYYGSLIESWSGIWQMANIPYMTMLLSGITLLMTCYYFYQLLKSKEITAALVALLGVVIAICDALAYSGVSGVTITVIFNGYILLAAISYAIRGTIKKDSTLVAMASLSIVAMLVARLFDPQFTFIQRGVAFSVVGLILVLANVFYIMNIKQKQKQVKKNIKRASMNVKKKTEQQLEESKKLQIEKTEQDAKVAIENNKAEVNHDE